MLGMKTKHLSLGVANNIALRRLGCPTAKKVAPKQVKTKRIVNMEAKIAALFYLNESGQTRVRDVELIPGQELPGRYQLIAQKKEDSNSPYHNPKGEIVVMTMLKGGRRLFWYEGETEVSREFPEGSVVIFDDQFNELVPKERCGHRSERLSDLVQANAYLDRKYLSTIAKV